MKKIIVLFLLTGIMVQGSYWEGNGGWFGYSGFELCAGIGGLRISSFSGAVGLGATKKYIPGIGIEVRMLDLIFPRWHSYMGFGVFSPYLFLILPIEKIHYSSGNYYYPSMIYLFGGGTGIFSKGEAEPYYGFSFGIGLRKEALGIEGGLLGVYDSISLYIGVSLSYGVVRPSDVVLSFYPRIHLAFDKDKSFPSSISFSSYSLPPVHIQVEERNLLDASIEIKGRLASCVDKNIYYLGTIKKDGKRTVDISFRDIEYPDYVDGKIVLKGKDGEGESYTEELEVPKIKIKDERYAKITNFEHKRNKIYFTYKFGWGADNIPYRIKSKIKGYVVAKYRLGKGSRWIYTGSVYGDINKEVGYGEHKFYWDLTKEFPVERTLEGLEFEVEIKK